MQGEVEFDLKVPCNDDELRANVIHALSLGLPELGQEPHDKGSLKIIANGPTARTGPRKGHTLALNGALGLWRSSGLGPAWWAACDPQALVADFLAYKPRRTTYLVASKCHPSVFEALQDRNVVLWHLDEPAYWDLVEHRNPIMVAPTITICAFELGERLGFSDFETWGWDGCYLDGQDHAMPQDHNAPELIWNLIGQKNFPTNRTWLMEAENAIRRFRQTPRSVTIHGPGMMAEMMRYQFS